MSQATKSFSETVRAMNSTSRAKRRDDPDRNITPVEATRGIYIDFEALSGHEPSLVGYSVYESLVQVVTDARLQSAADAKGLPVTPFGRLMSELHERAVTEDRRIVAFSQHELRVTEKWCGIDLGDRYADGRKIGKRWFNRFEPCTRPTEWSLAEFEKCLGIERPPHFGYQKAAKRLRDTLTQLGRRFEYDLLTPVAKAKWTKLLDYNAVDVESLVRLVRRAGDDLGLGEE